MFPLLYYFRLVYDGIIMPCILYASRFFQPLILFGPSASVLYPRFLFCFQSSQSRITWKDLLKESLGIIVSQPISKIFRPKNYIIVQSLTINSSQRSLSSFCFFKNTFHVLVFKLIETRCISHHSQTKKNFFPLVFLFNFSFLTSIILYINAFR